MRSSTAGTLTGSPSGTRSISVRVDYSDADHSNTERITELIEENQTTIEKIFANLLKVESGYNDEKKFNFIDFNQKQIFYAQATAFNEVVDRIRERVASEVDSINYNVIRAYNDDGTLKDIHKKITESERN